MVFGFKSSKSKNNNKSTHTQRFGITIITAGCHFSGTLCCKGSSRIAGSIDGKIQSQGLLVIEQEAQINADIEAEEVIIRGNVKGAIIASKRVELTSQASFSGSIASPSLAIQEGAKFEGFSSCDTKNKTQYENKQASEKNPQEIKANECETVASPIKLKDINAISHTN